MFRLVDSPKIFPQCSLTRSSVGPMVDTEVILNKGGRVYVTELEAGEIIRFFPGQIERRAREMGWLSPVEAAEKDADIDRLGEELEEARGQQTRVVSIDEARELLTPATA